MRKILNFGSLNIDYVYRLEHIVNPGETITSLGLEVFPGGKGLNQSVALARAGAKVYHAGHIGEDGDFLKEICSRSGVNVDYVKQIAVRTGNAIIQVAENGQNAILLFAGANRENTKEYVDEILSRFKKGDVLLLQNEVNLTDYMVDSANAKGMLVILNPSPYDERLECCDLSKVNVFIMNEIEGAQITGEEKPEEILKVMYKKYPGSEVVLTLGDKGSIYSNGEHTCTQEAISVKAVDTTAAGDTFTGYYIAGMLERMSKKEALELAAKASAIAVSRNGASSSIPMRCEVL